MIRLSIQYRYGPVAGLQPGLWLLPSGCSLQAFGIATLLCLVNAQPLCAAEPGPPNPSIEQRVQELIPKLDEYVASGMKAFEVPGVAIGIVVGDKSVCSKGYGVRSKDGPPVDSQTVFQIGSTTKAFLATTMAIAVDRGQLHWDDRVIDLDPNFQLKDPWVTREFRVFDLMARRTSEPYRSVSCSSRWTRMGSSICFDYPSRTTARLTTSAGNRHNALDMQFKSASAATGGAGS
ncbi:MAG TPA: serine hydrolase domain-containing protein [Chthoniobacterales bacterium]|jgi:beta-lactamase family protein|nr:serine hydrolase domain-containing protein [Chthoniobacterales bacterium]